MIENRRQYLVTQCEADRFGAALDRAKSRAAQPESSADRLQRASRDALESQLGDLRAELAEYEARTSSQRLAASGVSRPSFPWASPAATVLGALAYCWIIYHRPSLQPNGPRVKFYPIAYAANLMGVFAGCWLLASPAFAAGAEQWWRRVSSTFASSAFSVAALVAPSVFAVLIDAQELTGGSVQTNWFAFANGAVCAGLFGSALRTSARPALADQSPRD